MPRPTSPQRPKPSPMRPPATKRKRPPPRKRRRKRPNAPPNSPRPSAKNKSNSTRSSTISPTNSNNKKAAITRNLPKPINGRSRPPNCFRAPKPPRNSISNCARPVVAARLVDELFRIEPTSDPLSKFSQPIAVGDNQWIVARLDGEEKSRPKTFEEAKDRRPRPIHRRKSHRSDESRRHRGVHQNQGRPRRR